MTTGLAVPVVAAIWRLLGKLSIYIRQAVASEKELKELQTDRRGMVKPQSSLLSRTDSRPDKRRSGSRLGGQSAAWGPMFVAVIWEF